MRTAAGASTRRSTLWGSGPAEGVVSPPHGTRSTHTGRPTGTRSTVWVRRRAGRTGGKSHEAVRPSRRSLSLGQLNGNLAELMGVAPNTVRMQLVGPSRRGPLGVRRRTSGACADQGNLAHSFGRKGVCLRPREARVEMRGGPGGPNGTKRTELTACGARGRGKRAAALHPCGAAQRSLPQRRRTIRAPPMGLGSSRAGYRVRGGKPASRRRAGAELEG